MGITKRLKYDKINNADNIIKINLNNGYEIIALTGNINENLALVADERERNIRESLRSWRNRRA